MEWFNTFFDETYIKWQNINEQEYIIKCKKEAQQLYQTLKLDKKKVILDLCCGCGYHSNELANYGNKVVGIDKSKKMLEIAKKNKQKDNNFLEFINQDIRDEIKGVYDVVFCLNTSLGYFKYDYDIKKVLTNIKNCLSQNGLFILDLINPFSFFPNFQEELLFEINNMKIHQKSRIDFKNQVLINKWEINNSVESNEIIESRNMEIKFYMPKELTMIGRTVGLEVDNLYGDYTGEEFNQHSHRMILIFKKWGA